MRVCLPCCSVGLRAYGAIDRRGTGRGPSRRRSRVSSPCSTASRSTVGRADRDEFRVEDEAIVGGSLKRPVPRNEFLCLKREYRDFELRLQFKLLGRAPTPASRSAAAAFPTITR